MIQTRPQRWFQIFNLIFITLIASTMVLPLLNVVAQSFSNGAAINTGRVVLWPVNFTLENYRLILNDPSIWTAFRNSLIVTVFGTLINLAATVSLAYPLSRDEYLFKKPILILILITMIFHAPLIPNYLLLRGLNMLDTLWVLMIPGAISAFSLFIMRSFFMNLPNELLDSARMDGCSEIRLIWSMILPLSKPVMATMAIIYSVGNWNQYANAFYYINDRALLPLQVRLREIVLIDEMNTADVTAEMMLLVSPEGLKMAVIVVATVPIMLVYPFLQKYFIKGMLIGSLKT